MKKTVIFILMILFFISCTNLKEKNMDNFKNIIYNSIIIDDDKALSRNIDDFPINYIDENGDDLLKKATLNNSINSLKVLLKKGIEKNNLDNKQRNSIFYARSLKALRILLENGVNINIDDSDGVSLLSYFIQNRDVKYSKILLENGVHIDLDSLFYAVLSDDVGLIREMVRYGANFLSVDKKGNYPIYYAINEEIILNLLSIEGYDLSRKNLDGENILGEVYLKAVRLGNYNVIEKLLKMGVNKNYTSYGENAITIAESSSNTLMMNYLRSKGL